MKSTKKLWILLFTVLLGTFSILGFFGTEIFRQAPPIPESVVTTDGHQVMTKDSILTGQTVWQSIGGQQIGSIWGHGAYQAPDWTADWLHRESVFLLNLWAQRTHQRNYADLPTMDQAPLKEKLKQELRTNRYDEKSKSITISPDRLLAIQELSKHYKGIFSNNSEYKKYRQDYAIHDLVLTSEERRDLMMHFFFWTSWSASTNRPEQNFTYTNNWPHEPLIDNVPTSSNTLWSILSVVLLLFALGGLVAYHAFKKKHEDDTVPPAIDPLGSFTLTPSMKALWKYCAVVLLLFGVQCLLGALTAHYTVEGQDFFGIPVSQYLPYSLTRTWHIQTALFWIATAFLAIGLFLAPMVGGSEPKGQKLGVDVLFGALLVVVFGSLAGEFFAIHQKLPLELSFWLGHQGYEYTDLGRVWQIALFIGLLLWLFLMIRALLPVFKKVNVPKELIVMFAGASVAIGLFYSAGFFYGAKSHLSVMEYWRWWVVHLWVEGFFEVFATVSLAFIFTRLGLIKEAFATRSVLFSTAIFLLGGIPGTFHHLYFSGTPMSITAIGACFSALEVVPLVLIGIEAYETYSMEHQVAWMQQYRWPIRFFIGVAFWNFLGAGIFGFLINPPIALYYMQGLNTTAVHAHGATFGVYGLLSLGLVLFILRRLKPVGVWKELHIKSSFWCMNIGLILMIFLSLLPIGIMQTMASMETGLWFARSSDFLQLPHMQVLRWMRVVGDTLFLIGVAQLIYFALGIYYGWSFEKETVTESEPIDVVEA